MRSLTDIRKAFTRRGSNNHSGRRTRIPTGAVVALGALILVLPVAISAGGHDLAINGSDQWHHHHTRDYKFCNEISTSNESQLHTAGDNAANSWDNLSTTGVNVTEQGTCHPGSGDVANIELRAANYGDTNWRMTVFDHGAATAGYHATHTHMHFNREKLTGSGIGSYEKRTLACKGFGQVLGLKVLTEGENNSHAMANRDCMSFRGSFVNEKGDDDYPSNYDYTQLPGPHSKAELKEAYDNHSGVSFELGGTVGALIEGDPDSDGYFLTNPAAYTLAVTGVGETGVVPSSLVVKVDGSTIASKTCTGGGGTCSLSSPAEIDPLALSFGRHTLLVQATDTEGFVAKKSFYLYVPDHSGIGTSDGFTFSREALSGVDEDELASDPEYEYEDVGPVGTLDVNVSTGNAMFAFEDVGAREGISTSAITRYYNSKDSGTEGPLGPGWRMHLTEQVTSKYLAALSLDRVVNMPSGRRALFIRQSTGYCSSGFVQRYRSSPGDSASLSMHSPPFEDQRLNLYIPELDEQWVFSPSGLFTANPEPLLRIESPTGPTKLHYDSNERVTHLSFEDGSSNINYVRQTIDGKLRITKVERAGVSEPLAEYLYDSNARLVGHIDAYGNQTDYTYDSNGVLSVVDKGGMETSELTTDSDGTVDEFVPELGTDATDFEFHEPGGSSPSIYGFDEATVTPAEGDEETYDIAPNGTVGGYESPVELGTPPELDVDTSSSIPESPAVPIDPEEPIELEIEAESAEGVNYIAVSIDQATVWEADNEAEDDTEIDPVCDTPPCLTAEESVELDVEGMPPGYYQGEVYVEDEEGSVTAQAFSFQVPFESPCDPVWDEDEEWEAPVTRSAGQVSSEEVELATGFREAHGLATSNIGGSMSVIQTFNNGSAVQAELTYGVPLLPAEISQMEFQDERLPDLIAIIEDFSESRNDFAGVAMSEDDTTAEVFVTGNVGVYESALDSLLTGIASDLAGKYDITIVPVAQHTIAAAVDSLLADPEAFRSEHDIAVESASHSVQENQLRVLIRPQTDSGSDSTLLDLEDAIELLESLYPSIPMTVSPGILLATSSVGPVKAGTRYDFTTPQGNSWCTTNAAITTRRKAKSKRQWGVLTAGHCLGAMRPKVGFNKPGQGGTSQRKFRPADKSRQGYVDAMSITVPKRIAPRAMSGHGWRKGSVRIRDYQELRKSTIESGIYHYGRNRGKQFKGKVIGIGYSGSASGPMTGSNEERTVKWKCHEGIDPDCKFAIPNPAYDPQFEPNCQYSNTNPYCGYSYPGDSGGIFYTYASKQVRVAGISSMYVCTAHMNAADRKYYSRINFFEHVRVAETRLSVNDRNGTDPFPRIRVATLTRP